MCPCKYPLIILDRREGDKIKHISIPTEVADDLGNFEVPEFEKVREKGFDGKMHDYMSVIWKNVDNAVTKKYDVADHIIVAGCDAKVSDGKMVCKKKELYLVMHPMKEWKEYHMIDI